MLNLSRLSGPLAARAVGRSTSARRDGPRDGARARRCSCSTNRCPISTPNCACRCAPKSRRCIRRLKNTVIYVTHDQIEAMTMADRIVVMNAGRIEQIGAPLELYDRPANRFVAGFLGSPSMSFIPGVLERGDGRARLRAADGVFLPVGDTQAASGQRVEIGIRPEHYLVVDESGGFPFKVGGGRADGRRDPCLRDDCGRCRAMRLSRARRRDAGPKAASRCRSGACPCLRRRLRHKTVSAAAVGDRRDAL